MSVSIGQIIIDSANKEKLSNFLSSLIDLEIFPNGEEVILYSDNIRFSIVDRNGDRSHSNSMKVDLHLGDELTLEEVKQRFEFLNYRDSIGKLVDQGDIKDCQTHAFMEFVDFEGRSWRLTQQMT